MKISVIGAGSFGTAMATVAARYGNHVMLWAHDPRVSDEMRTTGTNSVYLPDLALGEQITPTSDLAEAAAFSDTLFMVVPSHHYRSVLTQLLPHLSGRISVIMGAANWRMVEEHDVDCLGRLRARPQRPQHFVTGADLLAMIPRDCRQPE